ncbi:MAG: hypothetical protein KGZ65_02595 [Sphingomonadales bacterium]|nr:hypothetical protein [Sphingomonadaceae bacterium]MBS3930094.1 hypothetical protein [Sphingomonadales bacterium]
MASTGDLARRLFRLRTKRARLECQISQLAARIAKKRQPGEPRPRWGNCAKAK